MCSQLFSFGKGFFPNSDRLYFSSVSEQNQLFKTQCHASKSLIKTLLSGIWIVKHTPSVPDSKSLFRLSLVFLVIVRWDNNCYV